ncbi:helix-turn-helix domain-containing protein [Pedobacter sp. MR2016-24]|uniref:helix-turn-helix domain-containing protein n=1 Tax=Pedobacter sp. MR2016-24 TaxID=2994466 RepID=UPI002246F631|nr:AraC family transcriptional regulator [Pedobacter sp. MR2016-24]MCX2483088.1 AraC family transcriptional regulator [Pedobacter sp. MR2016-24]
MDSSIAVPLEKEVSDSFSITFKDGSELFGIHTANRLRYNRMMLVNKGTGSVYIDDVAYAVADDQLFLISKGQILAFGEGSVFEGFNLVFGDCFWQRTPSSANNCKAVLFNNAADNQLLPLEADDCAELKFFFQSLYREFEKAGYINKLDALAAYLKIIMIKVANVNASLTKGIDSFEKQLYRQFLALISVNYHQSHEVSDYARQMGIPSRKLTALSKRCSGRGAKELINGQLIAEAKRSLQFSSRPVKEIAYELNFSTPDQFSHFFKKNVMVSPQDYRMRFVTSIAPSSIP